MDCLFGFIDVFVEQFWIFDGDEICFGFVGDGFGDESFVVIWRILE